MVDAAAYLAGLALPQPQGQHPRLLGQKRLVHLKIAALRLLGGLGGGTVLLLPAVQRLPQGGDMLRLRQRAAQLLFPALGLGLPGQQLLPLCRGGAQLLRGLLLPGQRLGAGSGLGFQVGLPGVAPGQLRSQALRLLPQSVPFFVVRQLGLQQGELPAQRLPVLRLFLRLGQRFLGLGLLPDLPGQGQAQLAQRAAPALLLPGQLQPGMDGAQLPVQCVHRRLQLLGALPVRLQQPGDPIGGLLRRELSLPCRLQGGERRVVLRAHHPGDILLHASAPGVAALGQGGGLLLQVVL